MHRSVLLNEGIEFLALSPGEVILDATVGLGGHAKEILKKITPGGKLIGIDCDRKALDIAKETLSDFKGSFELIYDNFKNIDKILDRLNIKNINGALFDLGTSSLQLDDIARGFSFRGQAQLDMRMDEALSVSAYDIVNKMPEYQLDKIIQDYGEERFHKRIANAIVKYRKKALIQDTTELTQVIYSAISRHYKKSSRIDPATRTFQGLRIAVNDELNCLKSTLEKMPPYLAVQGRLVVISFHSLEDRIVKHYFREMAKQDIYTILTKKPITPTEEETRQNPRARSAKLRAAEKNVPR